MPTGNEIIKSVIKFIHAHYNLSISDFEESIDGDFLPTDQAIVDLKNESSVPVIIKQLLDCFLEVKLTNQFMTDQFPVAHRIEIIDFSTTDYKKRNRSFSISDNQFGYLSTKLFLGLSPVTEITEDDQGYRTLIDFIGSANILNQTALLATFFSLLESNDTGKGILVHKFVHTYISLSIYSYLFFKKLVQGDKIKIDPILSYAGTPHATITLNATLYQQYFELFDIINEVNHAPEIITRFLKVYHMLEYLVYRVELVQIEKKARLNRSFIREIHSLTGKSSGEFDIFKRNFPIIFNQEMSTNYFSLGNLSQDQINFLDSKVGIKPYRPNQSSDVSKLIYVLRNSIVHNKESEFHMTTTNPDEYKDIIPLVKILIGKLEKKIFEKISGSASSISYQKSAIELY